MVKHWDNGIEQWVHESVGGVDECDCEYNFNCRYPDDDWDTYEQCGEIKLAWDSSYMTGLVYQGDLEW